MKICDLCKKNVATTSDRTVINNGVVEYHFCEDCMQKIKSMRMTPFAVMQEIISRSGKECEHCLMSADDFRNNYSFGCAYCFSDMRELAREAIQGAQGNTQHVGKNPNNVH